MRWILLSIAIVMLLLLLLTGCTVGQAQLQQPTFRLGTPPARERISIVGDESPSADCVDSDNTLSYADDTHYTAGFVITPLGTDNDACKGRQLIEYFCEFGHKKHEVVSCLYGCFDGVCLTQPEAEPTAPLV